MMGEPAALQLAYSAEARAKLVALGRLESTELTMDNWMEFPQITRETDFILGTWGLPPMDEKFLAAFPKLRAVFYAAGTVKGFVTDASYDRHVVVCSAASANAIPVAEYTTATILLSLKRFWSLARELRIHREWGRGELPIPGTFRTTVGIISLGAIGRLVAQSLSRFDLKVIAYDPFVPKDIAEELGVELVSLEQLFEQSEVVTLHAPWIPETVNMINERQLRRLKQGATFINTSRGAIVNETDLCRILAERPDLTAVLDVTHPEPPAKDSPLYELPNVVLTPHIAGSIGSEVTRMGEWMVDELQRYLRKSPLRHQVTREMLARMA